MDMQLITVAYKGLTGKICTSKIGVSTLDVAKVVKRYYSGDFDGEIQQAIHEIAVNPVVSQDVVTKLQDRLRVARLRYLRIISITATIGLGPHLVVLLVEIATRRRSHFLSGYQITGKGVTNSLFFWMAAAVFLVVSYYSWRNSNRMGYVADCLIHSLEFGLKYSRDPTNTDLRDKFGSSIQRVASCYFVVFRQAGGPRVFRRQVRLTARRCRADILSLLPALVTADVGEISGLNSDLIRLVIRSQTGYWHQTIDIARPENAMSRLEVIKTSFFEFLANRSIQVAMIAMFAGWLDVIMPVILKHF